MDTIKLTAVVNGHKVPMDGAPREYITSDEPRAVSLPLSMYYQRRLVANELREATAADIKAAETRAAQQAKAAKAAAEAAAVEAAPAQTTDKKAAP